MLGATPLMSGVLEEIRTSPGRYAVVGIPCFIKAVHLARAADPILRERIVYTLGLVCGHMKSARFAESLPLSWLFVKTAWFLWFTGLVRFWPL